LNQSQFDAQRNHRARPSDRGVLRRKVLAPGTWSGATPLRLRNTVTWATVFGYRSYMPW